MTTRSVFGGMGRLPVIAPVALATVLCSHGSAGAAPGDLQWTQDPGSHCTFVAPVSLTSGPTFWIGACVDGKASGEGMLRRRDGDKAGAAFFGRMKDGVPEIGVVDLSEGYRAGSFSDGDIGGQTESDPQNRIDAFRIAAEAARLVGAKYAAEKNAGSARLYEELAKTLELQTD
ncbi:hypothetical protein GGE16_005304 [Rhizobium leguminosarum]|uniref:Uncharacterized protein n=1 Tax=Rhizobium leguminosarum TaxID=384 RepID=A0AAE2T061_RHILE|nr:MULTISPECIES: hypothetical protein [Rhizobium]MBB4293219.1 hypothetical protein [Rhizobium leguminosarum]MBB4299958.1 hypothetical protein [Rhizobium leguminosarum]MBB4311084.1 hypothetical protein [Rhizobium leguminosarum]MBB4435311.1 hypothetical protein [Rhizobium esperanzae]MBB4532243.1 hypothetical protein [Rhizobium leguminosarum]